MCGRFLDARIAAVDAAVDAALECEDARAGAAISLAGRLLHVRIAALDAAPDAALDAAVPPDPAAIARWSACEDASLVALVRLSPFPLRLSPLRGKGLRSTI